MITYSTLSKIIPSDQALANKALSVTLQQITGIANMQLATLATAVSATQTMAGLPLVNAQTSAVSPATANYYINNLAIGTGPNNTITVGDIIGSAAGYHETEPLQDVVAQFSTMNLTTLTTIYTRMVNTLNGDYGISPVDIPPGPAAGTYTDYDDAFTTGLIPAANAEIVTLVATYPTQTTQLNTDWTTIVNQLTLEPILQNKAQIDYSQLIANDQNSIYSFIFSLPSYGQDTEPGGMSYMITESADLTTLSGQATVGCLRQGPTTTALNAAGISTNNNIPL